MPDSDAELLETLLTQAMRRIVTHGDGLADGHAAPALTMAESVLLIELHEAGEATQQQLADRLDIDKSRVSRLCSALEDKHLLARERDDSNRRNLRVTISPAGTTAATRLRRLISDRHERMLAAMTPQERSGLLLGLTALVRELDATHR